MADEHADAFIEVPHDSQRARDLALLEAISRRAADFRAKLGKAVLSMNFSNPDGTPE